MMNNENPSRFTQALTQEKHERIARNSLYDLFTFHESLQQEIARLRAVNPVIDSPENQILERMLLAQEHYACAMQGYKELGAEPQQNALVRFSDALLDLMKLIHKHKEH
jgi:hypothetical protein